MLSLLLAITFTTGIMILFKLFDRFRVDNLQAITINYLVAACFGFIMAPAQTRVAVTAIPQQPWFWVSLAVGVSLIVTFLIYALSTQKVGIAISAVTGKMSAVIPVMVGVLMFGESLSVLKIAGILIAFVAFWLTFKKEKAGKFEWKYLFLPVFLFIGNGANDSLWKIGKEWYISGDCTFFLACSFSVSLLIGLVVLIIRMVTTKKWPDIYSITGGILLGLANWAATYFFFLGLATFDISVFVPVFNVSIVILSALSGLLLFREKLRIINWIGIAAAVAAILLIAFS